LTFETKSKSELDDQSWTGFLVGVSNACKYDGHLQESACKNSTDLRDDTISDKKPRQRLEVA